LLAPVVFLTSALKTNGCIEVGSVVLERLSAGGRVIATRCIAIERIITGGCISIAGCVENGEKQLTRTEAVKALQALTEAGRTAYYNALKLDGRFAAHLSENHSLLSWKA